MANALKQSQETYLISELAAQLDMSPHTIRFYEEKGLISPGRTPGNQRIYTAKDRARLKLILRGKRFGFSLDEIAEMIGMADIAVNELRQIDKSLAYGTEKLKEIRKRKEDLELLEKDLMSIRENLLKRRKELQKNKEGV